MDPRRQSATRPRTVSRAQIGDPVGLDSQCFSYLIDALEGVREPADILVEERLALIRTWLYTPGTFHLSRTVVAEAKRIRASERRARHESWSGVHLLDLPVRDGLRVEARARALEQLHPKANDCRILAEAEDLGLSVLLTYDGDFVRRLGDASGAVRLLRPSEFWRELGVPRGVSPVTAPAESNPFSREDWWRW